MITWLTRLVSISAVLLAFTAAHAESRRTVAVLPVVVHASGDQAYLQSGVADMLASRLGKSPGVAVIRVNDPASATTDLNEAQAAATAVGADYVLYGSFTRFGEGASLDVRCAGVADVDEAKGIFIQSGTLGELIPRIDKLAEKVGRHVTGGALPAVAAPGDASRGDLRRVLERLDALEAAVAGLESGAPAP